MTKKRILGKEVSIERIVDEPVTAVAAPLVLKQYRDAKAQRPGSILLFRTGYNYETYYDDAETIGPLLGVPHHNRRGYPVAYFPAHHLEAYVPKLDANGHRVTICESAG